jgi:hypothetical protein
MLRHQQGAGEVDCDAPVPARQRQLVHRRVLRAGQSGIVDEGVQAAEALHDRADAGAHRRFSRDVGPVEEEHLVLPGRGLQVRYCDAVAACPQQSRDRTPDALRAARHQNRLLRHNRKEYSGKHTEVHHAS